MNPRHCGSTKPKLDKKPVESFAKRIVARVSLLEHVSQFVSLKEAGKGHAEMKGLCPFHEDKDRALYVNPAQGVCESKGCGAAVDEGVVIDIG